MDAIKKLWERISPLLKPPRRLRFTPKGTRFVLVALAIGVAAINTGNNLLYLILAMMLSTIIISGILSESTLRLVEVSRSAPEEVFADRPFMVRVTARNSKRFFPSISATFSEEMEGSEVGREYFLKIPAGGASTGSYTITLERRGIHALSKGTLSTSYPFGLFLKSRTLSGTTEILVYPRIIESTDMLKELGFEEGELESRIKGRGTDLYGLRGYVPGDDIRGIHWKTSAKLSKLYVREFSREDARRIMITLDNSVPEGEDERLEKGISAAATLASHYLHRGYQVDLCTCDGEVPMGIGMGHLYRILRHLALLTRSGDNRYILSKAPQRGGILILPHMAEGWSGVEGYFSKVIRL